jgi:hypothetical protein
MLANGTETKCSADILPPAHAPSHFQDRHCRTGQRPTASPAHSAPFTKGEARHALCRDFTASQYKIQYRQVFSMDALQDRAVNAAVLDELFAQKASGALSTPPARPTGEDHVYLVAGTPFEQYRDSLLRELHALTVDSYDVIKE